MKPINLFILACSVIVSLSASMGLFVLSSLVLLVLGGFYFIGLAVLMKDEEDGYPATPDFSVPRLVGDGAAAMSAVAYGNFFMYSSFAIGLGLCVPLLVLWVLYLQVVRK